MGKRKKHSSMIDEQAIDDLADLVVKSFEPGHHQALESFEAYAARIRARVHGDISHFRKRFQHGYRVLLDELEREHPKRPH